VRGKREEKLAEEFFLKRGWRLVARNYKSRRGEIDLLLLKGDRLLAVEVKGGGCGAERIDRKKVQRILLTLLDFLQKNPEAAELRIELVAALVDGKKIKLERIEINDDLGGVV